MSTFKVGDRVRPLAGHYEGYTQGSCYNIPREGGVVKEIGAGWVIIQHGGRISPALNPNSFELCGAPTGPVHEVTRKEIVPGTYGHILVDRTANDGALVVLGFKTTGGIFPSGRSLFSPDELRAAAATFIEIAAALEPKP